MDGHPAPEARPDPQTGGAATVRGTRYLSEVEAADDNRYQGLPIRAVRGLHAKVAERLVAALGGARGRVLDLACGSGALTLRLADLGFAVTGSDLSKESYQLHARVPFVQADFDTPFAVAVSEQVGGDFDAVCAVEIAEHLENPRHLVRQCAGLLRPGGVLVITTPNIESVHSIDRLMRHGTFKLFDDKHCRESGHITPIGQWQLRNMLADAGFAAVELHGHTAGRGSRLAPRKLLLRWLTNYGGGRVDGEIVLAVARKG